MKILHVINSLEGGGAESLTLKIHELSLKQGLNSHVLGLLDSSSESQPNTYSLHLRKIYQPLAILKLFSFLKQPCWQDLDLIHVHLFPSQFFTPIVAKILDLQCLLITTEHSTFNKRRNRYIGKIIDKINYSRYKKVVCISDGAAKSLLEQQHNLADKIVVIYNGVEIENYSRDTAYHKVHKVPIVLSVGRLVKPKNIQTSIQAVSLLGDHDFEYWIAGTGEEAVALEHLVNELDLNHKVKFLGFRKDIKHLLHQADVFLQTSLWEGFGLATVEAMACGLPVIASNVPGLREVVLDDCKAGFLVSPQSPELIAEKIKRLLNEPELRHEMGRNARNRALNFDVYHTFEKYLQLYNSLLLDK